MRDRRNPMARLLAVTAAVIALVLGTAASALADDWSVTYNGYVVNCHETGPHHQFRVTTLATGRTHPSRSYPGPCPEITPPLLDSITTRTNPLGLAAPVDDV